MPENDKGQQRQQNVNQSEEAVIFNTFAKVIRNKFTATPEAPTEYDGHTTEERIKRLDEVYKGSEYQAEKAMIQEMNNGGMIKGLACGLLTFGFLRRGPSLMQRYLNRNINRNHSPSAGGYTFDQHRMAFPGATGTPPKPGFFLRVFKLGLDLTVSVSLATYAASIFTDKKKIMKDMSQIPLVQGRSLVSDELCDDFIDVYRGIPKKVWKKYEGNSEPLDAITAFVMNCMKRSIVEGKIKEENRLFGSLEDQEAEEHVEIPSPGVDPSIPVEIEWGDKSVDMEVGKDIYEEDDFFDTGNFYDVNTEDTFQDENDYEDKPGKQ